MIGNIKGWYIADRSIQVMKESNDIDSGNKKYVYAQGLLLPKNKISRNDVLYDWDSIVEKHRELIGKPLIFNHDIDSNEVAPGVVVESWLKENDDNEGVAGWYYKAKLNPRSRYYEDITEGFVNNVSIQINANKVATEYMNGESYQRAFIDDIIEISAVTIPGFPQTTIETLIAEAYKRTKKVESVGFPYEDFKQGIIDEIKEHPGVLPVEAAQLVLDHLKNDINYYKSQNSDCDVTNDKSKEAITTSTASGAQAPAKLKKDMEEYNMAKEIKKEAQVDIVDNKDIDKDDTIKKEEYDNDMNSITDILERLNAEMKELKDELISIRSALPVKEESVDDIEADLEVSVEPEVELVEEVADDVVEDVDTNQVAAEQETAEPETDSPEAIETKTEVVDEVEEVDEQVDEQTDVESEEEEVVKTESEAVDDEDGKEKDDDDEDEEDIEEPIPPIMEKKKESLVKTKQAKKEKTESMTFNEALKGFTKERLNI